MTGLRGRDQRALGHIEMPLALGDPRLASMFAMFATMTRHEPMPVSERLTPWPRRWRCRARAIMGALFFNPSVTAGLWAYDSRWGTSDGPGKIKGK
jgi:hypothetical protein